jgi:hypothetical protein
MAKPSINAPTKDTDDPLGHNECRLALEPSLTSLAEAAIKVGWPPVMVAYSLMILSAQMLEKQSKGRLKPMVVH